MDELEVLCESCHALADEQRRKDVAKENWNSRVNGWARKVYGPLWRIYPGRQYTERQFKAWLRRKGIK